MGVRVCRIVVDCPDPRALAAWWAQGLGGQVTDEGDAAFVSLALEGGLELGFQRVLEPTPGKNRLHLDLVTPDLVEATRRFQALGATVLRRHETPSVEWVVLADPEDNQFCLVPR